MSAGAFSSAGYAKNGGVVIYPVRVQPETLTAWNPSAGNATAGTPRIRVRQSRRSFGIYCRRISGVWTTAPAGYKAGGSVTIPIMTEAAFGAIDLDEELVYLTGGLIRVTGKSSESGI